MTFLRAYVSCVYVCLHVCVPTTTIPKQALFEKEEGEGKRREGKRRERKRREGKRREGEDQNGHTLPLGYMPGSTKEARKKVESTKRYSTPM